MGRARLAAALACGASVQSAAGRATAQSAPPSAMLDRLGHAGPVLGAAADRFLFASGPLTESHSPAPLLLPFARASAATSGSPCCAHHVCGPLNRSSSSRAQGLNFRALFELLLPPRWTWPRLVPSRLVSSPSPRRGSFRSSLVAKLLPVRPASIAPPTLTRSAALSPLRCSHYLAARSICICVSWLC